MQQELLLEQRDGVAVLTLNRPERLNALTTELMSAFRAALAAVRADPATRVLVVTGGQRCFCAGADITILASLSGPADAAAFLAEIRDLFQEVEDLPQPVIAAVVGPAMGGGFELVLACDLCVAGNGARFGLPEVGFDLIPAAGGPRRLARLVGPRLAKELLLTGRAIQAEEASRLGLVNRVVPDADVLPRALELARQIAGNPPAALVANKRVAGQVGATAVAVAEEQLAQLLEVGHYRERLGEFLTRRRGRPG